MFSTTIMSRKAESGLSLVKWKWVGRANPDMGGDGDTARFGNFESSFASIDLVRVGSRQVLQPLHSTFSVLASIDLNVWHSTGQAKKYSN